MAKILENATGKRQAFANILPETFD